MAGFFAINSGECFQQLRLTNDLRHADALALLQELLLALHANDSNAFKAWLSLCVERSGKPAVIELLLDWINPILTRDEADRLVGWHMGLSL